MSHLTILDWLPLLSILAFSSAYWYEVGEEYALENPGFKAQILEELPAMAEIVRAA